MLAYGVRWRSLIETSCHLTLLWQVNNSVDDGPGARRAAKDNGLRSIGSVLWPLLRSFYTNHFKECLLESSREQYGADHQAKRLRESVCQSTPKLTRVEGLADTALTILSPGCRSVSRIPAASSHMSSG